MLTVENKQNILKTFPNIKLSYENIVYKKVYHSDYIEVIPKGIKCFIWFTRIHNKNACLIMKLKENKQIYDIQIEYNDYSLDLTKGTIIYGTLFNNCNHTFFTIEDIFSYKGLFINRMNWGDKLIQINALLKDYLNLINIQNISNITFGLPIICKNLEELDKKIPNISYIINTIQFKLFSRMNNFLFMNYNTYKHPEVKNKDSDINNIKKNNLQSINEFLQIFPENNITQNTNTNTNTNTNISQNKLQRFNTKCEIVFLIRPDIQDDIYDLYCLNEELQEEKHGIAHIPDYSTSVLMNKLFRVIKENDNLDALEESDDENEFENENIGKFVHLNKSYKMVCQFNHKFKKWCPIKLSEDKSQIISLQELRDLYIKYNQNKGNYKSTNTPNYTKISYNKSNYNKNSYNNKTTYNKLY